VPAVAGRITFLVKDPSDRKHADDGANLLGVQPSDGRDRRHKGEGVFDHVLDTPVSPIVLAIGSVLLEQDHRFLVISCLVEEGIRPDVSLQAVFVAGGDEIQHADGAAQNHQCEVDPLEVHLPDGCDLRVVEFFLGVYREASKGQSGADGQDDYLDYGELHIIRFLRVRGRLRGGGLAVALQWFGFAHGDGGFERLWSVKVLVAAWYLVKSPLL